MTSTRENMLRAVGVLPAAPTSLGEALKFQRLLDEVRRGLRGLGFNDHLIKMGKVWSDSDDFAAKESATAGDIKTLWGGSAPITPFAPHGHARLLGAMWHPKVMSGEWHIGDLLLGVSEENLVLGVLPISDVMLTRLVLDLENGFKRFLEVAPKRGFVAPEELLVMAHLAVSDSK